MPELPEVERAAALIRSLALGKNIVDVDSVQDDIVYSGTTHIEFANEIRGRKVTNVGRYGKVFYIELDGQGRMPVLHFGMTGMLQVKGKLPTHYREAPKKASTDWPPRYMKFILHFRGDGDETSTELAFLDARRLGRIKLCTSPTTEPPISTLGFDPILTMPGLEDFTKTVRKRTCPIKALLLDQSFSAGVGNWVADEILYHSRIHPEHRCHELSDADIHALHTNVQEVCKIAVAANAEDSKFPENWLFKHRWGKGKKKQHTLTLPSGEPATIKWVTVGGRTSAYIEELQKLPTGQGKATKNETKGKRKRKIAKRKAKEASGDESESDLTPLEDSDSGREDVAASVSEIPQRPRRAARTTSKYFYESEEAEDVDEPPQPVVTATSATRPRTKGKRTRKG